MTAVTEKATDNRDYNYSFQQYRITRLAIQTSEYILLNTKQISFNHMLMSKLG